MWLGDLNLHHPLWDEERNAHLFMRRNLVKVQVLIDTLAEFNLQMTLLKDIPMLQVLSTSNHTRPDNIYISSWLHYQMHYATRGEASKDRSHTDSDQG